LGQDFPLKQPIGLSVLLLQDWIGDLNALRREVVQRSKSSRRRLEEKKQPHHQKQMQKEPHTDKAEPF
jgi:hypothetical protein